MSNRPIFIIEYDVIEDEWHISKMSQAQLELTSLRLEFVTHFIAGDSNSYLVPIKRDNIYEAFKVGYDQIKGVMSNNY